MPILNSLFYIEFIVLYPDYYNKIKINFLELLNEIYFNIEWFYLKIKNFDLKQLIYDFDLFKKDHETNIICECLKMSEQGLIF